MQHFETCQRYKDQVISHTLLMFSQRAMIAKLTVTSSATVLATVIHSLSHSVTFNCTGCLMRLISHGSIIRR